jgi:hypothetical protein
VTATQSATVVTGGTTQLTFSLTPTFTDITLSVTWGAQPPDLDAHLSGPAPGGGRFHAFFVNPSPVSYAQLTQQADFGFGPEQIVIRRDPTTGQFVPGSYHFWVHNFSGSPEFNVSQARATIVRDGQTLGAFNVSAATGDPTLDIWYVTNLQIDAFGSVALTPVQAFTNGSDFTQLTAPPYGPKTPR